MGDQATSAQSKKLEAKSDLKGEGGGGGRTWPGLLVAGALGRVEKLHLEPGVVAREKVPSESWLLLQPLNSSS